MRTTDALACLPSSAMAGIKVTELNSGTTLSFDDDLSKEDSNNFHPYPEEENNM